MDRDELIGILKDILELASDGSTAMTDDVVELDSARFSIRSGWLGNARCYSCAARRWSAWLSI